ncbi:uncharacterized protein LOC130975834 [Arachis stenosperma]|uniref:uncharacterized protein LOC130975834 n=1 Tax=Arachis stenosperma TaxID=217475 RepID=UPI0025AC3E2F|nr:uncharacterized protein LOC130975834 [Arachis stenosperma]
MPNAISDLMRKRETERMHFVRQSVLWMLQSMARFYEEVCYSTVDNFPANSIRDYLLPAIQNLLKGVEALDPVHKEALEIIMKERSGRTFYSINKVMAGAHLAFPASVNNIFGEGGLLGKKDTTTDRSSEAASSPNTGAPSPAEDTRFRRIMLGNFGDMLRGKGKAQEDGQKQ